MASLNLQPLDFTLDGPGLTLEQLHAVFRHQEEMKARRREREAAELVQQAINDAVKAIRPLRKEHENL